MTKSRFLIALAALSLSAGAGYAQTASPPAAPAKPVPAVAAPAAPAAKPMQPAAAQAKKININTATAAELDTLKGIGDARAKKIIEERGKAKFKNFDDLVKRSVLPANVEAEIKDKITF